MEILTFEPLISGTRVELSQELREEMREETDYASHYIKPNDVPYFVLYGIWWNIQGTMLEVLFIEGGTDIQVRRGRKGDIISADYYSKSFFDILSGSISHDDQIKIWLYNNKPYLWNQLIDYYGSAKKIFDNYVRFNH